MQRVILVGGGLANSLIAYRLLHGRADVDLLLLERGETLGGNHVWCFHDTDLAPAQRAWMDPLIERSWSGYEVRFPRLHRRFDGAYHAVTSEKLHRVVSQRLGARVRYRSKAVALEPYRVTLDDGTILDADAIIDGRGDNGDPAIVPAFQKFVGLWVELEREHELAEPILMDATVPQQDGFRFLYTLPFGPRTLHVEDTRYSDTPGIDDETYRSEVLEYCRRQGWSPKKIRREERGVLPVVLDGRIKLFWDLPPLDVPRSGVRAALFHPTTGYSLPDAVRLADTIHGETELDSSQLYRTIRARSIAKWRRDGFYRLLNRMMFRAAKPERRYVVLERFYGLSQGLIERFYADRLTRLDRLRIVTGKPPVPMHRALGCLWAPGPDKFQPARDRGVIR